VETNFKDRVCEPRFFLAAHEVLRKGGQVWNRVGLSSLTAVTPWLQNPAREFDTPSDR